MVEDAGEKSRVRVKIRKKVGADRQFSKVSCKNVVITDLIATMKPNGHL